MIFYMNYNSICHIARRGEVSRKPEDKYQEKYFRKKFTEKEGGSRPRLRWEKMALLRMSFHPSDPNFNATAQSRIGGKYLFILFYPRRLLGLLAGAVYGWPPHFKHIIHGRDRDSFHWTSVRKNALWDSGGRWTLRHRYYGLTRVTVDVLGPGVL